MDAGADGMQGVNQKREKASQKALQVTNGREHQSISFFES
jgi:hypothetical protein